METENNFCTQPRKITQLFLQKCRRVKPDTWLKCLLIIALLCIAAMVAPKFTSAEFSQYDMLDPCEMAEIAEQWLEDFN